MKKLLRLLSCGLLAFSWSLNASQPNASRESERKMQYNSDGESDSKREAGGKYESAGQTDWHIFQHGSDYQPHNGDPIITEQTVRTGARKTQVQASPIGTLLGVALGASMAQEEYEYGTVTTRRDLAPGFYKNNKDQRTWHPWGFEHIYIHKKLSGEIVREVVKRVSKEEILYNNDSRPKLAVGSGVVAACSLYGASKQAHTRGGSESATLLGGIGLIAACVSLYQGLTYLAWSQERLLSMTSAKKLNATMRAQNDPRADNYKPGDTFRSVKSFNANHSSSHDFAIQNQRAPEMQNMDNDGFRGRANISYKVAEDLVPATSVDPLSLSN